MKKTMVILLAGVLTLSCSGCSEKDESSVSSASDKNIVLRIESDADFSEVAYTLEQLYETSDFIAEVKVKETEPNYHGTTILRTDLTTEIINVYKGEYNGETLVSYGADMKISEYMKSNSINTEEYTEEELENGYVHYDWMHCYVPEPGDTLIFFGEKLRDDNCFYTAFTYQGVFKCDGDNATIHSLAYQWQDGWMEPIVHDLIDNYGADIAYNEYTIDVTCNKNTLTAEFA